MPVPVNQPVVVRVVERICNRELRGLFFIFAKGLGTKDEGFGEIMVATGISHLDGFLFRIAKKKRSAERSEVRKGPVDPFLDRGRVPPSKTAVRRTVGLFGEQKMMKVDDIGLD